VFVHEAQSRQRVKARHRAEQRDVCCISLSRHANWAVKMNIIAQAEQVIHAADKAIDASGQYGLIGILLVMMIVGVGSALAIAFRFCAPLLKDFVASTVDLHESLKETTARQTATLENHGVKLDKIDEKLNRCPVVTNQLKPV